MSGSKLADTEKLVFGNIIYIDAVTLIAAKDGGLGFMVATSGIKKIFFHELGHDGIEDSLPGIGQF